MWIVHAVSFAAPRFRQAVKFAFKMRFARNIRRFFAAPDFGSVLMKDMPPTLDEFDRAILAHYQHNTRLPAQAIGADVGLSAAAVQRRIKRMRETGVIAAEIAQIDPAAVGLPVTVIVHVDIERETLKYVDAFKATMRKSPAVQQCWYTTGPTDFILVVRVSSMAAYEQFTREALVSHDNVVKFTSYVVLDEVKTGLALGI
jgi:Lrp/AsnC family transcriptional regulator, leucine-responsive regulatory protein